MKKKVYAVIMSFFMMVVMMPSAALADSVSSTQGTGTVAYSAEWGTDTITLKAKVTNLKGGTVYYIVRDQNEAAPSEEEVAENGEQLSVKTAFMNYSAKITVSDASSKVIYLRYKETEKRDFHDGMAVLRPSSGTTETYAAKVESYEGDFGTETEGYEAPAARTYQVVNTGNGSIRIAADDTEHFNVNVENESVFASEGKAGISVSPKTGLSVGVYNDVIPVSVLSESGSKLFTLNLNVSFEVISKSDDAGYDYRYTDYDKMIDGDKVNIPSTIYHKDTPNEKSIVYCINYQHSIGAKTDNEPEFRKISDASASNIYKYSGCSQVDRGYTAEELSGSLKYILYHGYPNNKSGLQSEYNLNEKEFFAVTQCAIWYFTDHNVAATTPLRNLVSAASGSFSTTQDMVDAYNALINGAESSKDFDGTTVNLFVQKDKLNNDPTHSGELRQNFINGTVSDESKTIDIPVTKVWKGYASDEERGDVTFKLTRTVNGEKDTSFEKTLTLKEKEQSENEWSGKFEGLPVTDENGNKYSYDVTEVTKGDFSTTKDVSGSDCPAFTFTNTKNETTKPVEVTLKASKKLDNQTPEKGKFRFAVDQYQKNDSGEYELVKENAATGTNDAEGNVTFTPSFQYSEAGEYYYVIREIKGTDSDINYDSTEYAATVKVTEESGELKADVTYCDLETGTAVSTPVFCNTTVNSINSRSDASLTVVKKDADDSSKTLKGAEFKLYDGDTEVASYTTDENGQFVISTKDNALESYLPVDGQTKELKLKETKAPEGYKLNQKDTVIVLGTDVETTYSSDHMQKFIKTTYSISAKDAEETNGELTITDEKIGEETKDSSLVLKKTDEDGRNVLAGAEFTLYEDRDGTKKVGSAYTTGADGTLKITTDSLHSLLDDQSEKTLYLKETKAPEGYQTLESPIEVTLKKSVETKDGVKTTAYSIACDKAEEVEGQLTLTVADKKEEEKQEEKIDIPVEKQWAEGVDKETVTIILNRDGEEAGRVELNEGNNWKHTFRDLDKTAEDGHEYKYTFTEAGNKFTYTVTEDGNGGYIITNYETPIHEEGSDEVSVPLIAKKTLDGSAPENNTFTFELLDSDGNLVQTKENDESGLVSFDDLSFTEEGTYEYTLSEVDGGLSNIRYDDTEYQIRITVTKNAEGKLEAAVTYTADGSEVSELSFENETTSVDKPHTDTPEDENSNTTHKTGTSHKSSGSNNVSSGTGVKTGDNAPVAAVIVLLAAAAALAVMAAARRRKDRE